ncbi:MAG: thioesterase family protein [Anaerolineae bacterium]|nr:thioesterase family protein [Anaerolineae bacterium]
MTDTFKFFTPVKVRYNDTDAQGHVYFGQYYTFFDEGVEAYLAAIGYDYQTMLAEDVDFVYAESHCVYKSSAKWPEILHVYTRLGHLRNRSVRFEFEILAKQDKRLVATGYIAAVTVNRHDYQPCSVPNGLRQAAENYQTEGK